MGIGRSREVFFRPGQLVFEQNAVATESAGEVRNALQKSTSPAREAVRVAIIPESQQLRQRSQHIQFTSDFLAT